MSNFNPEVEILAVGLSLLIPIVAIIGSVILSIRKKNRDTELRKAIIENHVEPESIKLLIEERAQKSDRFTMLRWGCILLGGGIGAIISHHIGSSTNSLPYWIPIIAGMGLGMLIAFVIEYQLTKQKDKSSEDIDKGESLSRKYDE